MRVPVIITEDNFPKDDVVYVYGGLLDPQNPGDFCTQMFPKVFTDRVFVKEQAIDLSKADFTAEVYSVNVKTGEAIRLTNRFASSVFPERLQLDYLIEKTYLRSESMSESEILSLPTVVSKHKYLNTKNLRKYLAVNILGNSNELVMEDCSINLYDLITWAANHIDRMEVENERMVNALVFLLDSHSISTAEGVEKAQVGLGSGIDEFEDL